MYPVTDGAVAMILAGEDRARSLTDRPVWVTGLGNCYDSFLPGERDLAGNFAIERAAKRAYSMAASRSRTRPSTLSKSPIRTPTNCRSMRRVGSVRIGQGGNG